MQIYIKKHLEYLGLRFGKKQKNILMLFLMYIINIETKVTMILHWIP